MCSEIVIAEIKPEDVKFVQHKILVLTYSFV